MQTILQDITLNATLDTVAFGNAHLDLKFSAVDGAWQSLTMNGIPIPLMTAGSLAQTLDFQIDGERMVAEYGASFLGYQVIPDKKCRSASLEVVFGICPQENSANGYEFELTCIFTLYPGQARLERSARLARYAAPQGTPTRRLEGFLFQLPGVIIGNADDCVVDAPGPFPFWDKKTDPNNFIPAATPFENLGSQPYRFLSAPDTGFGLMAVTNAHLNLCLCTWMDTAGQVAYRPSLQREEHHLTMRCHDERTYLLPAHFAVEADVQRVELAPSFPAALAGYRQFAEQAMPLAAHTPDWVREMVLLEVMPSYFSGGLKGLTEKLPFYCEVGFNTIHLMPHWVGGYSPIDFYAVEPSLGTAADLQDMTRTAHALGMRVLFDLVIHGFNKSSPIPKQRPELFVQDGAGNLVSHPTWGSISTDWANPDYRQYMADLATHHAEVYGADGYRVDAASFKGPNWDPTLPYPAYRSGAAADEVLAGMRQALRRINPDAVLLNEVFGPHYYTVCDLAHDNMTMGPQVFLEKLAVGEMNAAHYKAHLANIRDALPPRALRVYFARNHDTSWFYHFNGYTPAFLALDAVHVFFTIPEFFAGDPKNGPNPDDDPAIFTRYRQLFALRKTFPELAKGEVLLREVTCSNPMIFTGLRRWGDQQTLVAISLSDKEEAVTVGIESNETGLDAIQSSFVRRHNRRNCGLP